jgi:GDP-4-dehydro-6-deoxy-D-mannose reductase
MKAFITGASGFVGQFLWQALDKTGWQVFGCCLGKPPLLKQSDRFFTLDICDTSQVYSIFRDVQPTAVFHLAAMSFVPDCEKDFQKALAVNVGGTKVVAEAIAGLSNNPALVFVSSGNVYGDITEDVLPLTEDSPVSPTNMYSLTKVMAEEVIRTYSRTGRFRAVIFRPFNHIGPGQSEHFVVSNFARQFARMKLGKRSRRLDVGNLDAKRDFTDVRDIVAAYIQGACSGSGTYLLGSGRPHSILEIVRKFEVLTGIDVELVEDSVRVRSGKSEEVIPLVSCEKVRQELEWSPQISLDQSLMDVYQYWLTQEQKR